MDLELLLKKELYVEAMRHKEKKRNIIKYYKKLAITILY